MRSFTTRNHHRATQLLLSWTIAGLMATPTISHASDNVRVTPIDCQPLVAEITAGLPITTRRLEATGDGREADRQRALLLTGTFEKSKVSGNLKKLLECLAGGEPAADKPSDMR